MPGTEKNRTVFRCPRQYPLYHHAHLFSWALMRVKHLAIKFPKGNLFMLQLSNLAAILACQVRKIFRISRDAFESGEEAYGAGIGIQPFTAVRDLA
jgi:hypothetical protein